jgi:hypothetical protein
LEEKNRMKEPLVPGIWKFSESKESLG